jgi:uncharacterized membrane protein
MCFKMLNKNIKKMKWYDIGLVKLSMIALTLMVAKLWPDFLHFEWHYYLIIFILFAIIPIIDCFKK